MAGWVRLSTKNAGQLSRMLRWFEKDKPRPKPQRRRGGGGAAPNVRRCIAQENAQADGTLSVKFLDSDGAATGDAFDIFMFPDEATTNYTTYKWTDKWDTVKTDDKFFIKRDINGSWYLDTSLTKIGTC